MDLNHEQPHGSRLRRAVDTLDELAIDEMLAPVTIDDAIDEMRSAIASHVHESEATGSSGFLCSIEEHTPRLVSQTKRLRNEHRVLESLAADLKHPETAEEMRDFRTRVGRLHNAVDDHFGRGARVWHEAYNVDLGAGD